MKYPKPRKWFPNLTEKYLGDINNIIARSSWEIKFLNWCDRSNEVLHYSSEEVKIPYRSPVDMRLHKYHVDFKIKVRTSTGEIKTYLVEIKPAAQCVPPVKPKRQTKRYITECATFMVNQAKWDAADRWAKDRGWEFLVLTEKHLF